MRALVGPRIRERRRAKGLSQIGLAQEIGISASYLNLIEHNKRAIAGRTLNAIAKRLDMDPADLSDASDAALVDALSRAAAEAPGAGAERERVAEFAGRFPGWARLLTELAARGAGQRRIIDALSDRLAHDPYLAETTHLLLSSVSAVRATAAILDEAADLSEAERARFTGNLNVESGRMARIAEDLTEYFDRPSPEATLDAPVSGAEAFWRGHAYHIPELEADGAGADALLAAADLAEGEAAALRPALARYADLAAALPWATLLPAARDAGWDPIRIAGALSAHPFDVAARLAHAPPDAVAPAFGLVLCDGAGGVLFRKEAPGLALPRHGGACPLWPLYRALTQPDLPLRAILETPEGARLTAFAIARRTEAGQYGMPPAAQSLMLYAADAELAARLRGQAPRLAVGSHCDVCPRPDCGARRSMFILR